jgi:hypothetical protein
MNKTYKVNALETKPISVEITSDNAKYLTIKYMLDNPSNLENVFKEVFTQRYYSRYSIDFQELKLYEDYGTRFEKEIELKEAEKVAITKFLEALEQLKKVL